MKNMKRDFFDWIGWVLCFPLRYAFIAVAGIVSAASPTAWNDFKQALGFERSDR